MKKSYDALIVGSSPAALLTAFEMQQKGQSCAVVDSAEQLGGLFRPVLYADQIFSSHLEFISTDSEEYLQSLNALIPNSTSLTQDLGPITFHNGQVQPFLGFGETSFDAIEEGMHLCQAQQQKLNIKTSDIVSAFQQRFEGDVLLQSLVTQMDVSEEYIKVQLNSSDILTCKSVYFFENPHWLSKLLSEGQNSTPKSVIQKLGKANLWTSVSLSFLHKHPLTESTAMHVLSGAKEQMCFGQFTQENNRSLSHWLCFASPETANDSEALGAILREMKKQIKRMYPQLTESVEKEFISISANAYGKVPSGLVTDNFQLAKTPHLYVGGRFYSQTHGLSGDLSTVKINLSAEPSRLEGSESLAEQTI